MAACSISSPLACRDLLPLEPYAVRHLLTALTGIGGIVAVWATARAIGGSRAALLAALAIALCGTWYGAMFDHTKDIPFAAAMMGAVYFLVRIGRELPRPRWHLVLPFGLLFGCALGIRVLGMLLVGYAAFFVFIQAPISPIAQNLARDACLLCPVRASLFAGLHSRLRHHDRDMALGRFGAAQSAARHDCVRRLPLSDQNVPGGHVYYMADVPRWYIPTYMAIKLTLLLLVGALLRLALVVLPRSRSPRRKRNAGEEKPRWSRWRHSSR